MSRQYSVPTMLRMVPNCLLKAFFLGLSDLRAQGPCKEMAWEPSARNASAMFRLGRDRASGYSATIAVRHSA